MGRLVGPNGLAQVTDLWVPHYPMVPIPGWLYYPPGGANTTFAMTLNRLHYVPFTVSRAVKLASWGTEVTTLGTGSSLRSSIFSNSGGGGTPFLPLTKLVDASATVSSATVGVKSFTPASTLALDPLLVYWFAIVAQAGTAPTVRSKGAGDPFVTDRGATPAIAVNSGYWQGSITAALPTTAADSTILTAANSPAIFASFAELP